MMLHLLIAIIGILITILLVVGVHEFGHFIVARWVGVKVIRFSIGFGKSLYHWYGKSGTEYVIAAIPLGGYVKMVDENEESVAKEDLPFAYNRQPFLKKFAIVAAGPVFNLIFAFLIYWALFVIGFTNVVPVIGKIAPKSIAAEAGMKPQQQIVNVNDRATSNWVSIVITLLTQVGNTQHLTMTTKDIATQKIESYHLDLTRWKLNNLKPDPLDSLGIVPYEPEVPAIVGEIKPNSPAASQLKVGDKILAVNEIVINHWQNLMAIVDKHPETVLNFKIERHGKISDVAIKTDFTRDMFFKKHGVLGISADFKWPKDLLHLNKYGPIEALSHAWSDTKDFTNLNFIVFGKLLTGKISLESLGGPITIFESAGAALNTGITPFLSFLAFLSISIGLINILPIPGLDGGHMLFQVIELIIRRPVSARVQILFYRLGLIFILLLITQALINDIQRL